MCRAAVRSLALSGVVLLGLNCGATSVDAQQTPSYWAGNVSLTHDSSAAIRAFSEPRAAEEDRPHQIKNPPTVVQGPTFERRSEPAADIQATRPIQAPQPSQPMPASPQTAIAARPANLISAAYRQTAMLSQLNPAPTRMAIQPNTSQPQFRSSLRRAKPFEGVANGPTITPYLNLFRDENATSEGAPDYYTFVQPQMEQRDAQRRQQIQLQQVQRRMQRAAPNTGGIQFGGAVAAGASTPARFMDTAQFYRSWQR